MAITKTTTVELVQVRPAQDSSAASSTNAAHPFVEVNYKHTIDDAEDSDLPVYNYTSEVLEKFVSDGGAATSLSGKDALIVTVCQAIWS